MLVLDKNVVKCEVLYGFHPSGLKFHRIGWMWVVGDAEVFSARL